MICQNNDLFISPKDVVTCLKSEVIAGICEIFSKDYRNRCSGMPDLLVWNASSQKCKVIKLLIFH